MPKKKYCKKKLETPLKGLSSMARVCFVCAKGPRVDNLVSHANNKVKRWVYPNVHKMRFTITGDPKNKVFNTKVCTRCTKARKVLKVV